MRAVLAVILDLLTDGFDLVSEGEDVAGVQAPIAGLPSSALEVGPGLSFGGLSGALRAPWRAIARGFTGEVWAEQAGERGG